MIDGIAGGPLSVKARQPGVADQAAITRGGGFEPIGQVAAIAGARRRLAASVDEAVPAYRFIGCGIEVLCRTAEWITEDGAGE